MSQTVDSSSSFSVNVSLAALSLRLCNSPDPRGIVNREENEASQPWQDPQCHPVKSSTDVIEFFSEYLGVAPHLAQDVFDIPLVRLRREFLNETRFRSFGYLPKVDQRIVTTIKTGKGSHVEMPETTANEKYRHENHQQHTVERIRRRQVARQDCQHSSVDRQQY